MDSKVPEAFSRYVFPYIFIADFTIIDGCPGKQALRMKLQEREN